MKTSSVKLSIGGEIGLDQFDSCFCMSVASWHVWRAENMADAPFVTECIKFAILKKLSSSISIDHLWYAKVSDQGDSLINDFVLHISKIILKF